MLKLDISIILISLAAQIIMLLILNSNNLIPKKNQKYFFYAFVCQLIQSIGELGTLSSINLESTYITLYSFFQILKLSFVPLTFILLALAYNTKDSIKFFKFLIYICFLLLMLLFSNLYYINPKRVFSFGNLFLPYVLIYGISAFCMFRNIIRLCKKQFKSNSCVITLAIIVFLVLYFIQVVKYDFNVICLSVTATSIYVYIFYTTLLYKLDPLTSLFNRRCFNNNIQNIENNCILLFFDLNKFKEINDIYGHNTGDIMLKKIGMIIALTFSKYGKCFRLGGDEFCVILEKNLNAHEDLINKFYSNVEKEKLNEPLLPTVSVGCGKYVKEKNTIKEALNDADNMMYKVKAKMKSNKSID